jgi:hypothetical protein
LFADDGIIYKEEFTEKQSFTFATQTDIEGIIYNTIEGILGSATGQNFYLGKFPKIIVSDLNAAWTQSSTSTNQTLGLLTDIDSNAYTVGTFTANSLRLLEAGTMLKFVAPAGKHFMPNGTLMTDGAGTDHLGKTSYKWCKVISVSGNGTVIDEDGIAPIALNDVIPTGAILQQVIPNYSKVLINDVKVQLIDQVFEYKDFALRYDQYDRQWKIVLAEDINTLSEFATGKAGDSTSAALDASWVLYFKTDGEKYTITYRNLRYVMESSDEIRFFFDSADKIYDPSSGQIVRDKIDILNINRQPGKLIPFTRDFNWTITDAYRDVEGYLDSRKIQVQFIDLDDDGVIDDPDIFEQIVGEEDVSILTKDKIIFQK